MLRRLDGLNSGLAGIGTTGSVSSSMPCGKGIPKSVESSDSRDVGETSLTSVFLEIFEACSTAGVGAGEYCNAAATFPSWLECCSSIEVSNIHWTGILVDIDWG